MPGDTMSRRAFIACCIATLCAAVCLLDAPRDIVLNWLYNWYNTTGLEHNAEALSKGRTTLQRLDPVLVAMSVLGFGTGAWWWLVDGKRRAHTSDKHDLSAPETPLAPVSAPPGGAAPWSAATWSFPGMQNMRDVQVTGTNVIGTHVTFRRAPIRLDDDLDVPRYRHTA